MKEINFKSQVEDAAGQLTTTIAHETGAGIDSKTLPTPSFEAIRTQLDGSEKGVTVTRPDRQKTKPIVGARAIAAYVVNGDSNVQYSPSIVLPDGRIGILHNLADRKHSVKELAVLTDFQQLLLAGTYARQEKGVGVDHSEGVAELGHATLIAVSRAPSTIHDTTHEYADSKQFGAKISSLTTIEEDHSKRPTEALIVEPIQVMSLTFLPDHQSPLPVSSFEASAGFALAATKTQTRQRPLDLKANVGAMASQMGV